MALPPRCCGGLLHALWRRPRAEEVCLRGVWERLSACRRLGSPPHAGAATGNIDGCSCVGPGLDQMDDFPGTSVGTFGFGPTQAGHPAAFVFDRLYTLNGEKVEGNTCWPCLACYRWVEARLLLRPIKYVVIPEKTRCVPEIMPALDGGFCELWGRAGCQCCCGPPLHACLCRRCRTSRCFCARAVDAAGVATPRTADSFRGRRRPQPLTWLRAWRWMPGPQVRLCTSLRCRAQRLSLAIARRTVQVTGSVLTS